MYKLKEAGVGFNPEESVRGKNGIKELKSKIE